MKDRGALEGQKIRNIRYLRLGGDRRLPLHLALGGGFFTEDSDGKLCVVKATTAISIIDVEEWTKLLLRVVHAALFQDTTELGKVNRTLVHDVKILEHLHQTGFFRHLCIRFLNKLVLQSLLKSMITGIKAVKSTVKSI